MFRISDALKQRYPTAETFRFGDSAASSETLLSLVRSGKKTATCGALRDYENGEPMPAIGRRDIALSWDGTPALVIETVELVQCRFDEVTEAMALAEGEDDSLEGWRKGHGSYFERNGGFSPDLQILWERFILIEDLCGENDAPDRARSPAAPGA
ncbi:ASCH domain-containing protein [Rhodovulum sp. MB263]|uniref:ASCH domain-containing protein n=1 Tax=Rhodovulum sp. (strain MB263) TaxID=308754 RepID=UPI0009B7BCD0|nr:ASCH domain-containing protein [Rhodovulum sp. MB263]ARC88508.1 ASCH domain-containing protein [Rhodovulum sp. MB263]